MNKIFSTLAVFGLLSAPLSVLAEEINFNISATTNSEQSVLEVGSSVDVVITTDSNEPAPYLSFLNGVLARDIATAMTVRYVAPNGDASEVDCGEVFNYSGISVSSDPSSSRIGFQGGAQAGPCYAYVSFYGDYPDFVPDIASVTRIGDLQGFDSEAMSGLSGIISVRFPVAGFGEANVGAGINGASFIYGGLDPASVTASFGSAAVDTDQDGILDDVDNCPEVANLLQSDSDDDGLGDACDSDDDNDNIDDVSDNCPSLFNPSQDDYDLDGQGDVCDGDTDGDGVADADDLCPSTSIDAVIDAASGCDGIQRVLSEAGDPADYASAKKYRKAAFKAIKRAKKDGLLSKKEAKAFRRELKGKCPKGDKACKDAAKASKKN